MLKPYVVATNTAVTFIVMGYDEVDAVEEAAQYYFEQYGEDLDNPVAYDLEDYLGDMYPTSGIWELPTGNI